MALDKRRVQTAVIGAPDSEIPVVLPLEAIELDGFRRQHAGDTYWCGEWLGGCGQQLTTRLCTNRVCHFAHHPHASTAFRCQRTASGVSSADHLYIKQDMLDWITEQGSHATAGLERAADGTGAGAVLFTSPDGAGLRVLLSANHSADLGDQDLAHVLLSEHLTDHVEGPLARYGYVNLVRCVPAGTRRRVQVGTRTYAGETWFELSECALAPDGLSTPAVEEVRRLRTTRHPLGLRTTRAPLPAAAPPVAAAAVNDQQGYDRATVMHELERAVAEKLNVTKLRLCLGRAEAATCEGATLEEIELLRAAGDALLRMERGVGLKPSPVPHRPLKKRRARTAPAPVVRSTFAPKRPAGPVSADIPGPRQRPVAEPTGGQPRREDAIEEYRAHTARLKSAAAAVRGALRKTAREQKSCSWSKVRSQLGSAALAGVKPWHLAELLYLVDQDTAADEPLLTTLLAVYDPDPSVLSAFREAASRLDLDLPDDPDDLRDVLEADAQVLHDVWSRR